MNEIELPTHIAEHDPQQLFSNCPKGTSISIKHLHELHKRNLKKERKIEKFKKSLEGFTIFKCMQFLNYFAIMQSL